MQLRLVSWFFITLNLMEYVGSQQHPSRVRRQGRMHRNISQDCQGGCATCSEFNGCLTCNPKLFIFLMRINMKHIGMCLPSCPIGYFGQRYPERNECKKCNADCETCFNKNFCTKCTNGFYLHLGKCLENCPDWLETNNHTMECNNIVHCKINEWSQWSPCTKKGKTCGFKRGNETRVREVLQLPSTKGKPCPHTSEARKCVVQRKKCQRGETGRRNREERRKKPKREENKENRQENSGRESRRQNQEQRENKSKTQLKKRRVQEKQQKPVSISTVH
ncbi:R-spondin-3 isoform X1 [Rhineura floridana]|uniref:R-spondin-3 isoform X1 n=1 Tax=Rhineura floridana TaxID=261503 RepID=UPI002AC7FBD4|nr:R-spondin-3 isoform X1 [Rhineura floridana]